MSGKKKRKIQREMNRIVMKQECNKTKKERKMSQEHQMFQQIHQELMVFKD